MTQPTTADLYYLVRGGVLLIRPVSLEAVEYFIRAFMARPIGDNSVGYYGFSVNNVPEIKEGLFIVGSKRFTAKKIQE